MDLSRVELEPEAREIVIGNRGAGSTANLIRFLVTSSGGQRRQQRRAGAFAIVFARGSQLIMPARSWPRKRFDRIRELRVLARDTLRSRRQCTLKEGCRPGVRALDAPQLDICSSDP